MLLQKPRAYAEVANDINDDLVNFFSVLRDSPAEFIELIRLTPFARREFEKAHTLHPDPMERARRLVIRSFMGFASDSACNIERASGFRANANRSGTTPARDWANLPENLEAVARRLSGVTIENRHWEDLIAHHDGPQTLFYFDPPYLESVRLRFGAYKFELSDTDHRRLLAAARDLQGMVVISGYESELYSEMLSGWVTQKRDTFADGAKKRTEVLWIKP